MPAARTVRLFRNGRNQAVRIPREFELPGTEAVMRREGDRLVIESAAAKGGPNARLLALLATLGPLPEAEALSGVAEEPPEPVDL